jgi:hypothetical protein
MRFFLAGGPSALDDCAMRVGECEDLRDLRMLLHSGRDLNGESKCRQAWPTRRPRADQSEASALEPEPARK